MGWYEKESPFMVVEHGLDGMWRVHGYRLDAAGKPFDERQKACDFATERARSKIDSMVLLREQQERRKLARA